MKRVFTVFVTILILFAMIVFTGCTESNDVDLKSILSDINDNFSKATSNLTELTDISDLYTYYQISEDDVKQFAAEINTDTSTASVEIVLVEAVSSEAADNIKVLLENRYQSIYSQYASYSAEQFDMVKDCGVTESGNFVTLIVAENYDGILETVNSAIK